jgi:uncharacterized membrane protein
MSRGATIETNRRSIVKSISWRFFAAVITSLVVFCMTGKWEFAAKVGIVDTAIKLVVYFAHERAWNKIDYGRVPAGPDYEV